MEAIRSNMINQSDIKGRMSLFRYGLVVITVVTFIVSLLAPWASFRNLDIPDSAKPAITDFLMNALITTVIVAVIMIIVYFVYAQVLQRTVGKTKSNS
jgi:hypothetical protein